MPYDAKVAIVERFVHEALTVFRGDEMPYLVSKRFHCEALAAMGLADGPSGVCEFVRWLGSAFSDSATEVEDVLVADNRVVVRYTFEAIHSGEILGIPPSGKRVRWTGMFVARIEGSQIVELWRGEDTLELVQQLRSESLAA